jgi:hypothetical protein
MSHPWPRRSDVEVFTQQRTGPPARVAAPYAGSFRNRIVRNQRYRARMTDNTAIAAYPGFVIDCPDPGALARFYGTMLGWNTKIDSDWAEIRPEGGGDCISFQKVEGYRAPEWPDQDIPQQMHLDVMVRDLDEGEAAVIKLGATKTDHQPGTSFRVFLDPAGHPFCLCVD